MLSRSNCQIVTLIAAFLYENQCHWIRTLDMCVTYVYSKLMLTLCVCRVEWNQYFSVCPKISLFFANNAKCNVFFLHWSCICKKNLPRISLQILQLPSSTIQLYSTTKDSPCILTKFFTDCIWLLHVCILLLYVLYLPVSCPFWLIWFESAFILSVSARSLPAFVCHIYLTLVCIPHVSFLHAATLLFLHCKKKVCGFSCPRPGCNLPNSPWQGII